MLEVQDSRFKAQDNNSRPNTDIRKESYEFALSIIKYLEALPKDYICSIIGKQLLRSGTSIGANIVEARSASSRKDFINFYTYALKSANETKFWLELLKDSKKSDFVSNKHLFEKASAISNIIARSIITMKGNKY
jgi:four helix bundle protein